jgi:peptidoglycan/xylan/chitin deacetylase (PgdA/CDA1 family)
LSGFPILLYHRIAPLDGTFMDEYTVSPERFSEQLEWIARTGWKVMSLAQAMRHDGRRKINRTLVITFDDGFDDNRQYAWPTLERHGFPSDTFVVTGYFGARNDWDGPSRANYNLLSMDALASADPGLHTFHAHSVTHADLTFIDDDHALKRELEDSRRAVAELPNGGNFFAYPRGSWNWKVMNDVKAAGFSGALTSMGGLNSIGTKPFLLRRTEIHEEDSGRRFTLKVRTGRDLTGWPPTRPPEVSIFGRWLRGRRL